MTLLSSNVLESLVVVLALACAWSTRPWRLLAFGSRYELLTPLILSLVLLPALWWWPGAHWSRLAALLGANLVLLALGWPLAIMVFVFAAAWGVLIDQASWLSAMGEAFWRGVLPATLALGLGHAARRLLGTNPFVYLLGRGYLLPLATTFACALASAAARDDFAALGDAAPAALALAALGDAMLTGTAVALLVACRPESLATWSDALYLPRAARPLRREQAR